MRDFTASAPGVKLVGDVTYIPTGEGWVYLATVIDCFSKMVVGWSMADHYKTPLISSALDMAANNVELTDGCIFHSDRGSNYEWLNRMTFATRAEARRAVVEYIEGFYNRKRIYRVPLEVHNEYVNRQLAA